MPVDRDKAHAMIERFEKAAIDYERAPTDWVNAARYEKNEARKALFDALTGGGDA